MGGAGRHAVWDEKGEWRGAGGAKGAPRRLSSQGVSLEERGGWGSGHREDAGHLVVYYKYDCRMESRILYILCHYASM